MSAGTLNVDHNHDTGQVRNLLCATCNQILGMLEEDPLKIALVANKLIDYVRRWSADAAA